MSVVMIDEWTYRIAKARKEAKATVWARLESASTVAYVLALVVGLAGVVFLFAPDRLERGLVFGAWIAFAAGVVVTTTTHRLSLNWINGAAGKVVLLILMVAIAGLVFVFVPDAREGWALGAAWAAFVLGASASLFFARRTKRDFMKRIERLGADPGAALMAWNSPNQGLV